MKPNIIVFMTDQQAASTMNGSSMAKTPNVDRFLKKSTKFNQAYCPAPHCCPSRATFFSGLYPSEHGVWNNVEVDNAISRGLFEGVRLVPEILKENGYRTIFSGKWHVSGWEGPLERGFDTVLNEYISNFGRKECKYLPSWDEWKLLENKLDYVDTSLEAKEEGRIIKEGYPKYYQYGIHEDAFGDRVTVSRACEALDNYEGEAPLFMYVGTTGPHDPYFVPQEYLDIYRDENIELPDNFEDDMLDKPALYRRTREQFDLSRAEHIESIRRYLAFVSFEDALFGQLLDKIEEKGMWKNTVIMYLTDHGDYMGAHGLWAKGLPCFKEAYNICAAVGGMNYEQNLEIEEFISLADFAPTILELAGIDNPTRMTGKSLVNFIEGKKVEKWRTHMFTQTNGNEVYGIQRSVFNKKWKYIFNSFDYDELYNLEKDPQELYNVIKEEANSDIIKEFCRKMWEFAYESKDTCNCGYIMVRMAPYGPGIIFEKNQM